MSKEQNSYSEKCFSDEVIDENCFVGIHFKDGNFDIKYPLGYRISEDEKENKKDIVNLIKVLHHYRKNDKTNSHTKNKLDKDVDFPLYAYLFVYNWYLKNGYYVPKETIYKKGTNGKINWNSTIKMTKPSINNNNVIYLDFIVRKTNYNENELISVINRFCVYKSYEKIGCLFFKKKPKNEKIKPNNYLYISTLTKKIAQTFNDEERELFINMKKILESECNSSNEKEYYFGTKNFNLIWEKMIDDVYGNNSVNKSPQSHPHIYWNINNSNRKNITLRPDTIMIHPAIQDKIFVLDAKYYKAGADLKEGNMPNGESILKQIVYAQKLEHLDKQNNTSHKIYNAFLLPYGKTENENNLVPLGKTTEDWYDEESIKEKEYLQIRAIRLDTKSLMYNHSVATTETLSSLAELIQETTK